MSVEMKKLASDLQGNMELVGDFFDNPESVLDKYKIKGFERKALLSRNLDDLNSLGLSKQEVVGALSGAHSSGCHTIL